MFERFTTAARAVVVQAQEQARSLHHPEIRPEHLLLGVLADGNSISTTVLTEFGVGREAIVRELTTLGSSDEDALRSLGIDLGAVRKRAEAAFGPGALDSGPSRPRRGGLLRRVLPGNGGHIPFTSAAKQALEQSLRQALALQHNYISTEHILLGLLADDQSPVSRTLARIGADPAQVGAQVRDQLRRAAS